MKLWIRVDAAAPRDPKFGEIARELNIRPAEVFGLCAAVWCAMGEHAVDGDLSRVDDRTLEFWAMWEGRRGKFAGIFRRYFVGQDGKVPGYAERQGKLAERMERDRGRKRKNGGISTENGAEIPRNSHGNSTPTVRNGTERTTEPPSPLAGAKRNPDRSPAESAALPASRNGGRGPPPKGLAPNDDERAVIAHYVERHPRSKPKGDKIVRTIRTALKGYSVEELCRAIDGNADDEWHQQNAKHEITYVLRDTEHIDKFVELHRRLNTPIRELDPARARAMGVLDA